MVGGLLQIIAYAAQDIYLTNNPQITFFKIVYRRHTNFSMEAFEYTIQENPNFGKKNEVIIPRNGDVITKMYLRIVIAGVTPNEGSKFAWIRRLGHALIRFVEINIGGVTIDRQTGTWLDIWYELARDSGHDKGYAHMIGDVPSMTSYSESSKPEFTLYIPLTFWFHRHMGLALPMIAILYHQVVIRVEFENINNLIVKNDQFGLDQITNLAFLDVGVVVDYIYLDNNERENFSNIPHEYLIEQVQFTGEESLEIEVMRFKLDFNEPCKEMMWLMRNGNYTNGKKFLCYTHKDNWTSVLQPCAEQILEDSITLLTAPIFGTDEYGNQIIVTPGEDPPEDGNWEEFAPGANGTTVNGNINVTNNNQNNTLWVNTQSLIVGDYNLFDKIKGTIVVNVDGTILISNVTTTLNIRDVSIPVELLTDTRISSTEDVCINMFSNYGIYIDGSFNPIAYSLLEFNDQNRFDRRPGIFFNYLQPEMHHSNTPKDGINVYSFSLQPESHQPTGTSNLSTIENIIFTVWIEDSTKTDNNPNLNIINVDTRMYIFAYSYNIFRCSNGLAGLAYNG